MSNPIQPPVAPKSPWVKRGFSEIHGRGLYAKCLIPEGTRVIEYVGERITPGEANRRDALRGDGCVYLFEVNKRSLIDGDVSWNPARLINHACSGNCEPQNIRGRIWIVALRDIPADEELTYDYGFDFDNWRDHLCRCGTAGCVGHIVGKAHRQRVKRIKAREAAAISEETRQVEPTA